MSCLKFSFTKRLLFLLFTLFNTSLIGQDMNVRSTESESLYTGKEQNALDTQNRQKTKFTRLLFAGLLIQNQEKNQVWYIPSLFELFPPNTVEGFVTNFEVSFTQNYSDGRFYRLKPNLRYGFGNKRFQGQLNAYYHYSPARKASLQLAGGRTVAQFNPESTLSAFNNTLYTFLENQNFLKIYEKSYLEIGHSFAPVKNFLLSTSLSLESRSPLRNLEQYEEEEDEYTSNEPLNNELSSTAFDKHQALLWQASLRWQVGHRMVRHRGTLKSAGKYPAITVTYSGAHSGLLGSDLSYQKIALQVRDEFKIGKWGSGQFLVETGDFITKDELTFIDFKHFNGKRIVFGGFDLGDFQLLDYYQYSTSGSYVQVHYEHMLNVLPIKHKRLQIQPVISANYLYTPADGSYWELGVGLNKLFNNMRIDLFNSWRGSEHESTGIRIGFVFE